MAKRLQKKKRMNIILASILIFLVKLNLLAIPLYALVYADFSFQPLKDLNASIVSGILNVIGYRTHVVDSSILLTQGDIEQKIDISWDSTGWKSMYAIASLVIATPISSFSRRLRIAAAGVGIVFILNIIRIFTTIAFSATFGFNIFDLVHTVLWREGLILAVVGIWLVWLRMEKYNIGKIK